MKSFPILIASLVLLAVGCQQVSQEPNAYAEAGITDSTGSIVADSVKLVKTGAVQLQVADVGRSIRDLDSLTQQLGGMLLHQDLTYSTVNRHETQVSADSLLLIEALEPQATLTVRIPTQQLESFLFGATDRSLYPIARSLDIDDQSLIYLEQTLKFRNRTEILRNTNPKILSGTDRVALGDEAIHQAVANRRIDAAVQFSVVSLQLKQHPIIRKERVANTNLSAYRLPVQTRLELAFSTGGRLFVDVLLGLLHLWVFILLGIVGMMVYRFRKARRRAGWAGPTA